MTTIPTPQLLHFGLFRLTESTPDSAIYCFVPDGSTEHQCEVISVNGIALCDDDESVLDGWYDDSLECNQLDIPNHWNEEIEACIHEPLTLETAPEWIEYGYETFTEFLESIY